MPLTALDHGFAVELRLEREPAWRDRVAAWYLPNERLLVDAGGALTTAELTEWLRARDRRGPDALFIGHWHEDHSGGAAALAAHGLPVHAGAATRRRLRRPPRVPEYRARLWGSIDITRALPPPAAAALVPVRLPGHSPDQHGYLHEPSGVLFSGDLALRRNQRVAMPGEDPWSSMASIRHALALHPGALATSHRGLIPHPAYRKFLEEQLGYLEDTAARIAKARESGMTHTEIVRHVFGGEERHPAGGTWRDYSGGEFSTARWVRTFLRRSEAW